MSDQITVLGEYDIKLLRELNGEPQGLTWGAAMGVSVEYLHNKGYLSKTYAASGGIKYDISAKGKAYLAELDGKK